MSGPALEPPRDFLRVRYPPRAMPRSPLARVVSLVALAQIGGCGLLGGAPRPTWGAHVVFLTRPACSTFLAQTLATGDARAFSLLAVTEPGYTPTPGDILEGPAREGASVFLYYPPEQAATREGGRSVPADVRALGLNPEEARARLDDACGPPPRRPGERDAPTGF